MGDVRDADAGAEKADGWNSLERWKLGMSAATPLAIFLLGVVVTCTTSRESLEREEALQNSAFAREQATAERVEARADRIRIETEQRETGIREVAGREAVRARDETFRRERLLRAEAHAREVAMRSEADRRESVLRLESREEARVAQILDRRFEVWTRAGALLSSVRRGLDGRYLKGLGRASWQVSEQEVAPLAAVLAALQEANTLIDAYETFFSTDFLAHVDAFSAEAREFARLLAAAGDQREALETMAVTRKRMDFLAVHEQLMFQVRREVALDPSRGAKGRPRPSDLP